MTPRSGPVCPKSERDTDTRVLELEPSIDDLTVYRRAVEAVMWGMPAVNYQMMYDASARAGGPGDNQVVFWPRLLEPGSTSWLGNRRS